MKEFTFIVKNKSGMHARPSGRFVTVAKEFESDITVMKNNMEASGKRLLSLMALGASYGTELCVKIEGNDEEKAFEALKKAVDEIFGEE